jgi:hypothetical protein
MTIVEHGEVHDGGIVLSHPVTLPEGTKVVVAIAAVEAAKRVPTQEEMDEFVNLPFHGMWADREDMADSVAWVRRLREQWSGRFNHRD